MAHPAVHKTYHILWGRSRRQKYISAGVIVVVFLAAFMLLRGGKAADNASTDQIRSVEVKSVVELSAQTAPLSIVGVVDSTAEASVRAEASGQVTGVYRSLGDHVSAGTVVAELENSSQRAAVLQSQGVVDAAEAVLSKVRSGTRPEQIAILQSALQGAQSSSMSALLTSYSSIDNAIRGGTDAMFFDPDGPNPVFSVTTPDSHLIVEIQNIRGRMGELLSRERAKSASLQSGDDLPAEIARTQAELRSTRDFLDDIIQALNKASATATMSATTIATYQASTIAARATINASVSSLSTALQALQTAENNMTLGIKGPQDQDVAAAEAALKQARGAYAAAQANLEKSIIRSPIPGTINSFSLKRGDYVQQTFPVLTVANNGALEVIAYVTEQDRSDISVGDKVTLEDGAMGVVTHVAPALDPLTKRIEVRVGVNDGAAKLVNGQSVTVGFTRHTISLDAKAPTGDISIPIAAIKVGADNVSVFTVSASSTLEAHTVVLGQLLGDRVAIKSGLTPDMYIVTDARGLRAGQTVTLR